MAKSKKRGPAQKSKSSYAQELQIKKQLGANIIADWTAQLCLDTMAIVLNDPEVMAIARSARNGSCASARPSTSYLIRLGLPSLRAMRLNTGA